MSDGHSFDVQMALPTEPCDPRDQAISRMAIENEELRTALGIALNRLSKAREFVQKLKEVTSGYIG